MTAPAPKGRHAKPPAGRPFVLEWLVQVHNSKPLSLGARALALGLVTHANPDGSNCRPGDKLLQVSLGVGKRALLSYRQELRAAGFLAQDSAAHPGWSAQWRLTLPQDSQRVQHSAPVRVQHRAPDAETGAPPCADGCTTVHRRVHGEDTPPALKTCSKDLEPLSLAHSVIAKRLPDATAAEREKIIEFAESRADVPHAYLRAFPVEDLEALLAKLRAGFPLVMSTTDRRIAAIQALKTGSGDAALQALKTQQPSGAEAWVRAGRSLQDEIDALDALMDPEPEPDSYPDAIPGEVLA